MIDDQDLIGEVEALLPVAVLNELHHRPCPECPRQGLDIDLVRGRPTCASVPAPVDLAEGVKEPFAWRRLDKAIIRRGLELHGPKVGVPIEGTGGGGIAALPEAPRRAPPCLECSPSGRTDVRP